MIVCHDCATRFFEWLKNYIHHKSYSDIGDALACWLEDDSGVEETGGDYSIFLQTVICILVDPAMHQGVTVRISEKGKVKLERPANSNWLNKIGEDVFKRAMVKHAAERMRMKR